MVGCVVVRLGCTCGDGLIAPSATPLTKRCRQPSPPNRGVLGPEEWGFLTVTYTPKTSGAPSFQRFGISTPGGNRAALQVRGAAEGPRLTLSTRVLDFGSVRVGQVVSKVVYIENTSDVAAMYEFRDEGGGVILLSRPQGVIAPRSVGHTRVVFAPVVPANYWRRLACVLKVCYNAGWMAE